MRTESKINPAEQQIILNDPLEHFLSNLRKWAQTCRNPVGSPSVLQERETRVLISPSFFSSTWNYLFPEPLERTPESTMDSNTLLHQLISLTQLWQSACSLFSTQEKSGFWSCGYDLQKQFALTHQEETKSAQFENFHLKLIDGNEQPFTDYLSQASKKEYEAGNYQNSTALIQLQWRFGCQTPENDLLYCKNVFANRSPWHVELPCVPTLLNDVKENTPLFFTGAYSTTMGFTSQFVRSLSKENTISVEAAYLLETVINLATTMMLAGGNWIPLLLITLSGICSNLSHCFHQQKTQKFFLEFLSMGAANAAMFMQTGGNGIAMTIMFLQSAFNLLINPGKTFWGVSTCFTLFSHLASGLTLPQALTKWSVMNVGNTLGRLAAASIFALKSAISSSDEEIPKALSHSK